MTGFRHDAHPMGMLISTLAALSTFYPEARNVFDPGDPAPSDRPAHREDARPSRRSLPAWSRPALRLSRQRPQLHRELHEYAVADAGVKYKPNPTLSRALDVLFILHADHEQNCSTSTMRTWAARRPIPTARLRRPRPLFPARCTAAPTRQSCACSTKSARVPHSGVHQEGEGRRVQADGLRPPRLQELRSAGQDHQVDRPRKSSK